MELQRNSQGKHVVFAPPSQLLASQTHPRQPLAATMWLGAGRVFGASPADGASPPTESRVRGPVATKLAADHWLRAEPGPCGPLVVEVRPESEKSLTITVYGNPDTPSAARDWALGAAAAWCGLQDHSADEFFELAQHHRVVARLVQVLGVPRIGALPRPVESFTRAVLGQLVQGVEAGRSASQLVQRWGEPAGFGLRTFPTGAMLGTVPDYAMRECGISARGAHAIHGFVTHEQRFSTLAVNGQFEDLNVALQQLRGVGIWTSAETRLYLGDPNAVSFGDYHLPRIVGWSLCDPAVAVPPESDEAMAELLAPFAPHRGRVQILLERAEKRGLVRSKPRRGPRAALSAHRYW